MAQQPAAKEIVSYTQELTSNQARSSVASFIASATDLARTPAGTLEVYRRMPGNPTIAMARVAATAPIRAGNWAIETDDGVPTERVQFIRGQIASLWPMLVKDVLYALDYGFQAFEKIFELRGGRMTYRKLKALAPEKTEILVDAASGAFAGLRQDAVMLPAEKCFVFTYDGEAGNFYGRSRHENIRDSAYHPWMELCTNRSRYFAKVAGVIPVIEYPEGESLDANGTKRSNFALARAVLQNLGSGKGVAMPNVFARYAGDLARSGVDLEQLRAWHITFLETKQQHGQEFTQTMRHLESLMLRGWLVPERAATEGQHGTKAEAVQHARLGMSLADLVFQDIIRFMNWYMVNPLLVLNFGRDAENSVRLVRSGLNPGQQEFFRSVIQEVLTAKPNIDLFLELVDLEAMLDVVGLPKAQQDAQRKKLMYRAPRTLAASR